jgi:hypothetical protein
MASVRRQLRLLNSVEKHPTSRERVQRRSLLLVEHLESRDLLSASVLQPSYVLLPLSPGGIASPFAGSGPSGYTPAQIRHAYGLDQLANSDGAGTTIAIVDAFDAPTIVSDLHQFDVQFGLPDPVLTKVNQTGGSSLPTANSGWALETSLDVEWAHAIAPKANILLVEASSNSTASLFAAVSFAAKQPGVVVVSMSFGASEFSGETNSDSTFTTPAGHTGVTFVASSGDSGAPVSYPAASPNVLSVGGTTLHLDSQGNLTSSETGWSGSGGGISTQETQPAYQHGVVTQSSTRRTNPDVSYDADPNTGFPVFDTFGTSSAWEQVGGTSDAAPQWAAIIAIADEGRILAGKTPLDGASQTLPMLYSMPASNFRDITSGTSTGSPQESAGAGYDLVTGRGSPLANLVVPALIGAVSPTQTTHFVVSAPSSATAGSAFTITVTAADSSGNAVAGYLGTINFSSTDLGASLPTSYTFKATDAGVHTFTLGATLFHSGSQSISVADAGNSAIAGSTSVSVAAAAAGKLVFSQQPTNVVQGTVISPAVAVQVQDAFGNVVTGDNTDQVTVAIGTNPAGGTFGGQTTVTVNGGVATFNNLSIDKVGNGYILKANLGALSAPSASFNVTTVPSASVLESFENSDTWNVVGARSISGSRTTAAAHDGSFGFDDTNGNDWIYRSDAAAQAKPGDQLSVWLKFSGSADGRAYFGFGASSSGTFALVAAPNSGQFLLQEVFGFGTYVNVGAVSQSFLANHWYRLEVDLGTNGTVIGKLFDSNGTTLINQVSATGLGDTSGGFGFRAIGSDKYWDTVTDAPGVNGALSLTVRPAFFQAASSSSSSSASSATTPSPVKTAPTQTVAIDAFFAHVPTLAVNEFSILMPHVKQNTGSDPWWLLFA